MFQRTSRFIHYTQSLVHPPSFLFSKKTFLSEIPKSLMPLESSITKVEGLPPSKYSCLTKGRFPRLTRTIMLAHSCSAISHCVHGKSYTCIQTSICPRSSVD